MRPVRPWPRRREGAPQGVATRFAAQGGRARGGGPAADGGRPHRPRGVLESLPFWFHTFALYPAAGLYPPGWHGTTATATRLSTGERTTRGLPVAQPHASDQPSTGPSSHSAHSGTGGPIRMQALKGVGEPCAGEPHARINVAARGNRNQSGQHVRHGARHLPPNRQSEQAG